MKTLGVLGGMGSMATVDFFEKVVQNTLVNKDQDHIHIIVENFPSIPDRTECILNGTSPVKEMKEAIKRLELCNVDFIAMPCNTAHYYYDDLSKVTLVPILNMIEITLDFAKRMGNKKLLLWGTHGTYSSDIYKTYGTKMNLNIIYPNELVQVSIQQLIYDFKSTSLIDEVKVKDVLKSINREEIDNIILGCTELPIIFNDFNFLDPTTILAKECILHAGGKVK